MGAILRRPFPEFGMSIAWYGDRRVVVEHEGNQLYDIPITASSPRAASQAMDQERDRLHNSCQAFC